MTIDLNKGKQLLELTISANCLNKNSPTTHDFYAMIQNRFHYAITGQTAAEIIYNNADHTKEHMGLITWKNSPDGRILKSDVTIAKNYLQEKEIRQLERAVTGYFDYIEDLIELLVSAKIFSLYKKIKVDFLAWNSTFFRYFVSPKKNITMSKGTHFIGQPLFGQLISLLDKSKILKFSREKDGERYVKHFNAWQHMVIMLYAVIKRFDSLREITDSMFPEARKLSHLGINMMPRRSTLSDANARRSESIFEATYRDLYATYKDELSSDSRKRKTPQWMNRLQIIDSTTITLFSNLLFKGIGRNPKSGKKKGGIKVHANIHANEGVPSDIKFTSAATNDSFMLKPANYAAGDILAFDRAYIDYAKFEELTRNGVVYVTKMKKNLVYTIGDDTMYMTPEGKMSYRVQHVTFTKYVKDGEDILHEARIITYVDIKKTRSKLISLLTNDMEMPIEEIVEIYRKRWEIELLFKQLKQNFPLRYFYGESSNAIKIQIWVTLIANLLIMILQKRIKRPWSFSGLATMVRIMLMHYVNCYTFFEEPEKDWLAILESNESTPPEPMLFD